MIASSPTDLQPVLDTLIANAVRLTGATKGHVWQKDAELLRNVANYGETREEVVLLQGRPLKIGGLSPSSRSILEQRPVQITDAQGIKQAPDSRIIQAGIRTMMAVPLMREGTAIGSVTIWRDVVEPFNDRQIALVQTFANEAVIAIENVRLFQELKEFLEQQTATAEILNVIAGSPTDIQPVLETVAATAARLCVAVDTQIRFVEGNSTRLAASFGTNPASIVLPNTHGNPAGRAILERQPIHVHDLQTAEKEFPHSLVLSRRTGTRTFLSVPMLREGVPIGAINIRRTQVQPFTDKQIALLKTFADQAVIAIENVTLFQELTEALEQQTATSEILKVIASSPTDIQPVLDTIAENAARVRGADDAVVRLVEAEALATRAHFGPFEP